MNSTVKKLDHCLCCNSSKLTKVLDLQQQPLANSYLKSKEEPEEAYPLAINYCDSCTHIQLTHAVDPDLLFKNYLYVSGTTQTLKDYFNDFVNLTKRYTDGKAVLDIACNDGTQLNSFKEQGYETYGIDPATNLYELSSKNHSVVCDYFNFETSKKIPGWFEKFDIVVAQNVFAHNSNPKDFLEACKKVMKHNGYLFIQTSQANMVEQNQFDTIYHEHISFFSVKSMAALAQSAGLYIKDVIKTPVHGTSFVFVLSKWGPSNVTQFLSNETILNQFKMIKYAMNCSSIAKETNKVITDLRAKGFKVIGYGAAAKGNTFLNFSGFTLDYIVDDNPMKQNLYTPGSRILIKSPETLKDEKEPIYVVPLAWNFFDEIKKKVQALNSNVRYIRYFPYVETSNA